MQKFEIAGLTAAMALFFILVGWCWPAKRMLGGAHGHVTVAQP